MKDWHEIAKTFATNGLSEPQITKSLIELGAFADIPYRKAYDRVRKYLKYQSKAPTITNEKKPALQNFEPKIYKTTWGGTQKFVSPSWVTHR